MLDKPILQLLNKSTLQKKNGDQDDQEEEIILIRYSSVTKYDEVSIHWEVWETRQDKTGKVTLRARSAYAAS